jgi:hypothetical protein
MRTIVRTLYDDARDDELTLIQNASFLDELRQGVVPGPV